MTAQPDAAARLITELAGRHLTIAVAESLTGGLLVAELVRIPGASAVLRGGVVAYQTALKHSLLGVDAALLAEHGAVHPEVARQMATGVRTALAVDGRPADIGVATTGVAGPHEQDGQPVGTVYLGVAFGDTVQAIALRLQGDRTGVRRQSVEQAIEAVCQLLETTKDAISE
jgi:nicotinamide-nucleotide amidase